MLVTFVNIRKLLSRPGTSPCKFRESFFLFQSHEVRLLVFTLDYLESENPGLTLIVELIEVISGYASIGFPLNILFVDRVR